MCILSRFHHCQQSLFNLVLAFALHELLAPLIDSVPPKSGTGASSNSTHVLGSHRGGEGSDDIGSSTAGGKGKGKWKASSNGGNRVVTAAVEAAAVGANPGLGLAGGEEDEDELVELVGERAAKAEVEVEEDDVSVADLLANANRQAKVFVQAPGAEDGKRGDAGTLAFALQVSFFSFKNGFSLLFCPVLMLHDGDSRSR